jgi:serine/threonine-protein kinase
MDTLFEKASSGAGEEKELLKEPGKLHQPTDWSRDGRFLLYTLQEQNSFDDVWVLPLDGATPEIHKPILLLGGAGSQNQARFSPDMRWIAYSSDESGRAEVYVRPFQASGPSGKPSVGEGRWQISREGGTAPRWRADGKEIFFAAPPNGTTKMAAEVKANGDAFEPSAPQRLFTAPPDAGWDVTADGKRFLLAIPQAQQNVQAPITMVLNWAAQLKK